MRLIPLRSPYGLLQEDVFPDEWLVLIVCMMLNQTSRKQVEKVFRQFRSTWPNAAELLKADKEHVSKLLTPLGFRNRRTEMLFKMSDAYCNTSWKHVKELPGIGEYASRAWEMICLGIIGTSEPKDGALKMYWKWAIQHEEKRQAA